MRFRLSVLLVLLSLSVHANETLRFGIDLNYPPFSYLDEDGRPQGLDVDVAYAVCADLKANCQVVYQDWPGLVKALYMGKYDAILSSMQVTAERNKVVDFTDAYYTVPSRLIARTGLSLDSLGAQRRRIGVLSDSTQESFAKDRWGVQGAVIVSYDQSTHALRDLRLHQLDAVLIDCIAGDAALEGPLKDSGLVYTGPRYRDAGYFGQGASIAIKKGDISLQQKLNSALRHIQTNGVYQKIKDKYFSARQCGK